MAGIIYNKQIEDTLYQGTGEKCLVLEPYTAYQVPFSFGKDWNKIRLGVIWSWVSTTGGSQTPDTQYNTPIADTTNNTGTMRFDAGGVTNVSNSFFGIMKDNEVKSLPFDADCSGFVGWQGNAIDFTNDTGLYAQRYLNRLYTTDPVTGTATGRSKLVFANGTFEEDQYISKYADCNGPANNSSDEGHICPRTYGLGNPYLEASGSGIDPSASGNYASFWGLEITHTGFSKRSALRETFAIEPLFYQSPPYEGVFPSENHQYPKSGSIAISDASTENLRNIINGSNLYDHAWYFLTTNFNGGYDRQININLSAHKIGSEFENTVYDPDPNSSFRQGKLPDSVFFYNGFSDLYVRIHAWAVLRIE